MELFMYLFSYAFISRMKNEIFVLELFLPVLLAELHV